jgi:hypothetical protein
MKNLLVISDDAGAAMAGQIAMCPKFSRTEWKITRKTGTDFAGTDLLPADLFLVGCAESDPPSFAYLAEMLAHINLAGRPCGLFCPAPGPAEDYLRALVRDSEAQVKAEVLTCADETAISDWVAKILA